MLGEVGGLVTGNAEIAEVLKTGNRMTGIRLTRGDTYLARQFLDATVNAELAQYAGVPKLRGFGTFGLPEAELPVTLCFETFGVTVGKLRQVEDYYLRNLLDPNSRVGRTWLDIASGGRAAIADLLRRSLTDSTGNPLDLYSERDFVDVRGRALSIGYHARRNKAFSLKDTGFLLDNGNVAVLGRDRLSWNSLLFFVTGSEAEALARNRALPTEAMLAEFENVRRWFVESFGATAVRPARELYIRHAGNILNAVSPLSGAQMLAGGVPDGEALGTFGYHFDVRGGIDGLGQKAIAKGYQSISVHEKPIFNIGIRHAQLRDPANLAVVSPGSGFEGYASSAGRIVEYNVGVAQGLGVAAALAQVQGRQLGEVSNAEVRSQLQRRGKLSQVYGVRYDAPAEALKTFEKTLKPQKEEPIKETGLTDIDGHWAEAFVRALSDRGIVAGTGNRQFQPDLPLTRAAFAAILTQAFDLPPVREPQVFLDVTPAFWGYSAIRAANQQGFMAGFPNGTFRPGENVTRSQAFVALVSGLNLTRPSEDVESVLSFYRDRPQIPRYAEGAIVTATTTGLVANYPNLHQLQPQAQMTRAEVAVTVYQALHHLGRVPQLDSPYLVTSDRLSAALFSDLDGHWSREFVEALSDRGILDGYPDGTFRPQRPISRAAFASLLTRAFDPQPQRPAVAFRDVPANFWGAEAIDRAYRGKLMSGVSGDRFAPQTNLRRVAAIVALAHGLDVAGADGSVLSQFEDADDLPDWAKPAVAAAVSAGIVANYPDSDRLNPNRDATRGEVAVMLYRALRAPGRVRGEDISSPYIVDAAGAGTTNERRSNVNEPQTLTGSPEN